MSIIKPELLQFMPKGATTLADLTDKQLEECNERIAAVMKQLQTMQTAVRKEGTRREVAAIDAEIKVWTDLYKFITNTDPKLKKAKPTVGARTNRLQHLKDQLAAQVSGKEAMLVEGLTLRCHGVFREFLRMLPEGLETAMFKNVTFTEGPASWKLMLPFAKLTHLHIEGVPVRVEMAAFSRMKKLQDLTIKNPCTGKLSQLGEKPVLETLRINTFAIKPESAEVTSSLGSLSSLPSLPGIKVLELVNCGLQGDIRDLNCFAKTVELVDIGFNPGIKGKAEGLVKFFKLRRLIITRCHIIDVWDNFLAWMNRQTQLTQVFAEGVPMFGDHAKKYVAAQFASTKAEAELVQQAVGGQVVPELEKRFIPMNPDMEQLIRVVEGAAKMAKAKT